MPVILNETETEHEFKIKRGGEFTFSASLPEGSTATFPAAVTLEERWYYTDAAKTQWAPIAELTSPDATVVALNAENEYRVTVPTVGAVAAYAFIPQSY